MLLDECNACGKQLSWVRKNVSLCHCGADWREAPNTLLPEHETALSRLAYQWFGFLPLVQDNSENNPLYGLDFPNVLQALLLVASQQEGLVVVQTETAYSPGKSRGKFTINWSTPFPFSTPGPEISICSWTKCVC